MDYEKKYKEAQKWIESIYSELSHEQQMEAEAFFPELKESEDERVRKGLIKAVSKTFEGSELYGSDVTRIRKALIDYFNHHKVGIFYGVKGDDILAWLEKQAEQKVPVVDFKAKDWYVSKVDGKIHNIYYSADKVEPKFHEGDWVINALPGIKYPHLITDIQDGYYIFGEDNDYAHIASNDNVLKLWSIQDAKPGDVLFHSDSASNGIFIFKELFKYEFGEEVICYCDYDSEDHFCLGEHHTCCWADAKILHPATKEQRDTLFQKMREAGYKFDFEKKELKRIDAELTDFEKSLKHIMLETLECGDTRNLKADAEMLLRLAQKPVKWSEEDDKRLKSCLNILQPKTLVGNVDTINTKWLKSLKERYKWKPSDIQMKALKEACDKHWEPDGLDPLYTLYEQLKKLTE